MSVLQDTVTQGCVTHTNTCIVHHSPVHIYLHKYTGILGVRETTAVDQKGKHSGPPGDGKTER